jgi:vacuolar-type H+-ATPase subunit F/Vma7
MSVPAVAGTPGWAGDLVVVAVEPVAAGFRLAGVRTVVATTPGEASAAVEGELAGGAPGVVAVDAGLWRRLPAAARAGFEESVSPLVVGLPDATTDAARSRRDRIRDLLARSVGYEITFTSEGSS